MVWSNAIRTEGIADLAISNDQNANRKSHFFVDDLQINIE
jgi:hypothetical protein